MRILLPGSCDIILVRGSFGGEYYYEDLVLRIFLLRILFVGSCYEDWS